MFPVCTGINRDTSWINDLDGDVPCMHRDKPGRFEPKTDQQKMFPVCTGINRPSGGFSLPLIFK